VRVVSYEETLNAFDDPFGDKLVQNSEPQLKLPAYEPSKPRIDQILEPATELSAPPADVPIQPVAPTGEQPTVPLRKMKTPIEPAPVEPAEPPRELPLGVPTPSDQSKSLEPEVPTMPPELDSPPPETMDFAETKETKACKRLYNERDCCEEDQKCKRALLHVRQNSIKNISLDITASFKPDADSVDEEGEARNTQLRLMPARKWRNRAGKVIAEGRLTDLRSRRAVVADSNSNVSEIRLGELSDDDLCFLAAWWGVPTECTLGDDQFAARQWEPVTFAWKASALCHKPLYFEEVQLERYGHTAGPIFQPVLSGAHFFLNVAVLPYKAGINPPNECQYALGYYRPGSCAPWLVPPVPLSVRGGLMEAGAVTGLVLLFP